MAVIDMKKVILIGMQREKAKILKSIQSMGNVEISDFEEQNGAQDEDSLLELTRDGDLDTLDEIQSQLSRVEFALNLIGQYSPVKKGMFDLKPEVDAEALSKALSSRGETLKVVDECKRLNEALNELDLRETRLNNTIVQMEPWSLLDIPLDRIEDTATTRVVAGTVNKGAAQRFLDALNAIDSQLLFIQKLGEAREDACFFVVYHISIEEEISAVFKELAFSKSTFAGLEGTPSEIIASTKKQLSDGQEQKTEIMKKITQFSSLRQDLELLYDALLIEMDRYSAAQNLMKTDQTFILNGWVPAVEAEKLSDVIRSKVKDIYIKFEDPAPDEAFPVALDNPTLVTPFEAVTNLYSIPNSKELDPNIIMAPFYTIFFGIMMGDAGYGLIMAIACWWAIKKLKLKGEIRNIAGVIAIGGISTFIWGAIFGGWFGDAGTMWGIKPIWFNPSDEPIKMLVVCFAMGVVHIFVGMGVKAYASIREGHILDALFDQGLWYVFYIGLILWLAGGIANLGPALTQIGKIMFLIGVIGLILTQGRDKKNIILKLLSGILSLYNVTGFLSDILSYSRLFALGLTTGVIGMVINQLGGMLGTSWLGWIFAAVILVGGHLFNILINVLGAFVHTSRLQYIEFYGKFFEGGGQAFKPLGLRTKYIDIKRN